MALRHLASQAATTLRVRCVPMVHLGFSLPLFRSFSTVLENLKYDKSHEWVRVEGDVAYVGITDYAQAQLGDVVHAEVSKSIDDSVTKGGPFALVESVKAVSEVYAPISGTIVEVNETLDGSKNPELVNTSPYEKGWFAKIKITNPSELDSLLSAEAYKKIVAAADE